MDRGIGFEQYAAYDSDADERSDPTMLWDERWTGSATQIEVWPIPSSNDMTMRMLSLRPLPALTSNDDTAALDDRLITLYAAAELLAGRDAKDARLKLAAAQDYKASLLANAQGGRAPIVMGGGGAPSRRSGHTIIRVT